MIISWDKKLVFKSISTSILRKVLWAQAECSKWIYRIQWALLHVWPWELTTTLITLERLLNKSVTWFAFFRNLIQQLVPITFVNIRGHQVVLFACGDAAYNWGLARVSTEFVHAWFSPRAEESDGMKERCKAEPLAIEHVQTHLPAGTDCPGKSKATEVSECFFANRLTTRPTDSYQANIVVY